MAKAVDIEIGVYTTVGAECKQEQQIVTVNTAPASGVLLLDGGLKVIFRQERIFRCDLASNREFQAPLDALDPGRLRTLTPQVDQRSENNYRQHTQDTSCKHMHILIRTLMPES